MPDAAPEPRLQPNALLNEATFGFSALQDTCSWRTALADGGCGVQPGERDRGAGGYADNQRVGAEKKRNRWVKFFVYFLIVHIAILTALAGPKYFAFLVAAIIMAGFYELCRICLRKGSSSSRLPLTALSLGTYLILAFGLFSFAMRSSSETIVFLYITIVFFDGFSQVTGQLVGKHQLVPWLSPNKTVEGTLGGVVAAMVAALTLRSLGGFSIQQAVGAGLLLSSAGLLGDLAASWFKRINGIKDFGGILPGHGGILDRFDSLLVAGPTFWVYTYYVA